MPEMGAKAIADTASPGGGESSYCVAGPLSAINPKAEAIFRKRRKKRTWSHCQCPLSYDDVSCSND